jgi:3-hydroxybutyryl-CoA dehydratase
MRFFVGQNANFSKTITETDVYNFAGICGDFNPVHVNRIEAQKSIFGRQIVHGVLVASLISTVLGMYLPGPGTIYLKQSLTFQGPVYFGDTITARVEILSIDSKDRAALKTVVVNQNGDVVIEGEALVKLPKDISIDE